MLAKIILNRALIGSIKPISAIGVISHSKEKGKQIAKPIKGEYSDGWAEGLLAVWTDTESGYDISNPCQVYCKAPADQSHLKELETERLEKFAVCGFFTWWRDEDPNTTKSLVHVCRDWWVTKSFTDLVTVQRYVEDTARGKPVQGLPSETLVSTDGRRWKAGAHTWSYM